MRRFSAFSLLCILSFSSALYALEADVQAEIDKLKNAKEISVRVAAARALRTLAPKDKEVIAALTEGLKDVQPNIRRYCAGALEKIGTDAKSAVPVLIELVKDAEPTVRATAIEALGVISPPSADAVPVLAEALKDPSSTIRSAAAAALSKHGAAAAEARAVLVDLTANEKNNEVLLPVLTALASLDKIPPELAPAYVQILKQGGAGRVKAIEALEKLGADAIPALIAAMKDESTDLRRTVMPILSKQVSNKDAVKAMAAATQDKDTIVRRLALSGLASIQMNEEIFSLLLPNLKLALNDKDPDLRIWACKTIQSITAPPKDLLTDILPMLSEADKNLRHTGGDALAKFGADALPELVPLLKSLKQYTRTGATHALAKIGEPAIAPLVSMLEDCDPDARAAAAEALAEAAPLSKAALPALINQLRNRVSKARYAAGDAVAKFGVEAIPALLATASQENAESDCLVEALRRIGTDAVPQMIEALKQKDLRVFEVACRGLEKMSPRSKEAVPALLDALNRELPEPDCFKLQKCVAYVLTQIGPDARDALPAIVKLMQSSNHSVSSSAAYSLSKVAAGIEKLPPLGSAFERVDTDSMGSALRALGQAGVRALLDELSQDTVAQRQRAAHVCIYYGPTIAPELAKALKSENWQLRAGAALALGDMRHCKAQPKVVASVLQFIPNLKEAIADQNAEVCLLAAQALSKDAAPEKDQIAALSKAWTQCSPETRLKVIPVISALEFEKAPEQALAASQSIMSLYKCEQREVRVAVRQILPRIATFSKECIPMLTEALRDDLSAVRNHAARVLEGFGADAKAAVPSYINFFVEADKQLFKNLVQLLVSVGPDAVPPLLETLQSDDSRKRSGALAALIRLKPLPTEVIPVLNAVMNGPSAEIRCGIINLIATLGPAAKNAAPTLIKALQDEERQVNRAAMDALAAIGAPAAAALMEAMASDDPKMRDAVATALAKIKPEPKEILPGIQTCLKSKNVDVRVAGLTLLGTLNVGKEVAPALLAAASDENPNIRARAVRAMRQFQEDIPPEISAALLIALKDENPEVRQTAVMTLGQIPSSAPQAIPIIAAMLKTEDVTFRRAAIHYLGENGKSAPNDAVPPLAEALKDETIAIRRGAADALRTIGPDAKIATPLLIDALKDVDLRVRQAAAKTLKQFDIADDENIRQGLNEIAVFEFLELYAKSQEKFHEKDRDGDGVFTFATSLKDLSDLDPKVALAEGPPGVEANWNGYRFKMLKGQSDRAFGGKRDYVYKGQMSLGHALLAYPAQHHKTGRSTMIVGYDGAIYEKDLGAETDALVAQMTELNPDDTWARVKQADAQPLQIPLPAPTEAQPAAPTPQSALDF